MKLRRVAAIGLVMVWAVGAAGCKDSDKESPLAELARACHDSELSCPRPILGVKDLASALRYYRDVLGFKVDWTWGEPPDFGSVSRGHTTIFLAQGGGGGSWLMSFTPDVDKLYEEIKAKGAIIKMPPTNMPWHVREMQVEDPDRNVIRIGTGLDHED